MQRKILVQCSKHFSIWSLLVSFNFTAIKNGSDCAIILSMFHENKLHIVDSSLNHFEKLNRCHSNYPKLIINMRICFRNKFFVFGRYIAHISQIVIQLRSLDCGFMVIHFQIFTIQSLIPDTMPARLWTSYSYPSKYIGIRAQIQDLVSQPHKPLYLWC